MSTPAPEPKYAVYYEGGTVDRHWVAPAGLSLTEAKQQRVGRRYKSEYHARMKLERLERGYA